MGKKKKRHSKWEAIKAISALVSSLAAIAALIRKSSRMGIPLPLLFYLTYDESNVKLV